MIGTSKLVGIDEIFEDHYLKISKLNQLKFDLDLAKHSGISGYNYDIHNKRIKDIKLLVEQEERKQKLEKLNGKG